MTRIEKDKEVEMKRVDEGGAEVKEIPTVEELLKRMRDATGTLSSDGFQAIKMTGSVKFIHQGAFGTSDLVFSNDGQFVVRNKFGKLATLVEAYGSEKGIH